MTGIGSTQPADVYRRIANNVQRVIQGKPEVVRLAIVALFAEGHLLIEDVPGLGKTSLARSLARSVGGMADRIQFTPDLLPGDITGVMVFNKMSHTFDFHHGPVFTNILLADEVNRGTPKTQSALLEAMAERSVTVGRQTQELPQPFMVVATQNPIELDGTYRLPEAQLDRFLMRLEIGYPDHDAEVRTIQGDSAGVTPDDLPAVIDLATLRQLIATVRRIPVHDDVCSYAVRLAASTRQHEHVRYGASPRGSIALIRAARAWAATVDCSFVTADHVKEVAPYVLAHRLVLTPEAELGRKHTRDVLAQVLGSTAVPRVSAPATW